MLRNEFKGGLTLRVYVPLGMKNSKKNERIFVLIKDKNATETQTMTCVIYGYGNEHSISILHKKQSKMNWYVRNISEYTNLNRL